MITVLPLDDDLYAVRRQWDESGLDNLALLAMPDEPVCTIEDAVYLVEKHQPDVVLLDWYMGSEVGNDVYAELEERWPDLVYFGNSSIAGKFAGLVNVDKDARKLFDAIIPLIRAGYDELEE